MSAWVEPTDSGRYRGCWRLGRKGPRGKRTFDFEWQAQDWAERQEQDAKQAAADLRAVADAAHIAVHDSPPRRRPGRPLVLPEPLLRAPEPAPDSQAEPDPREQETFGSYARAWLGRQDHLKRKGHAAYQTVVNFICDWSSPAPDARLPKPLGDYPLAELTYDLIRDWRADQVDQVDVHGAQLWAPATINPRLARVRQICNAAVLSRRMPANPTTGIKSLTPKAKRPHRTLTDPEQNRLLKAATPAQRAWLLLGLKAGLRWEEVFGLDATRISRDVAGVIWIEVSQVNEGEGGRVRYGSTKTGEDPEIDFRTVPLPPDGTGAEVWGYVETVRVDRGEEGLLFPTGTNSPRDYSNWYGRDWAPLVKAAGLAAAVPSAPTFHDLRHTYLTHLAHENVPLPVRMALAGHRKIETAARYQHRGTDDAHADWVKRAYAASAAADPQPPERAAEAPRLRVIKGGAA